MTETINAGAGDYTPAELAREIAGIIRDKTDRWGQGAWFYKPDWPYQSGGALAPIPVEKIRESLEPGSTCNSTACVAGWAAILTSPIGTVIVDSCYLRLPGHEDKSSLDSQGQEALDLSPRQADWLFSSVRSQAEVLAALDAIAAGEDWEPDDFNEDEDGDGWDDEDEDD